MTSNFLITKQIIICTCVAIFEVLMNTNMKNICYATLFSSPLLTIASYVILSALKWMLSMIQWSAKQTQFMPISFKDIEKKV